MTRPSDATQPRRSTVRQQLRWAELRAARLERTLDEERKERAAAERDRDRYGAIVAKILGVLDEGIHETQGTAGEDGEG